MDLFGDLCFSEGDVVFFGGVDVEVAAGFDGAVVGEGGLGEGGFVGLADSEGDVAAGGERCADSGGGVYGDVAVGGGEEVAVCMDGAVDDEVGDFVFFWVGFEDEGEVLLGFDGVGEVGVADVEAFAAFLGEVDGALGGE